MNNKDIGQRGEDFVALYLQERGFTITARNYLIKGGEIDLIARQGDLGLFVEVKTRHRDHFPLTEVITPQKQRFLIRAAQYYLMRNKCAFDCAWRFDVACVHSEPDGSMSIEYIENAFYSE